MAAPAKRITLHFTAIERARYEDAAGAEQLGIREWLHLAALRAWASFVRRPAELRWGMGDKPIGEKIRAKLGSELDEETRRDMDALLHLRLALALYPGAPLTEGTQPTAVGHIGSAITKLERAIELRRINRKR